MSVLRFLEAPTISTAPSNATLECPLAIPAWHYSGLLGMPGVIILHQDVQSWGKKDGDDAHKASRCGGVYGGRGGKGLRRAFEEGLQVEEVCGEG